MNPRLTVLAGPTAVGKGTVAAWIRENHPEVWLSVSATTRRPRPGEVDGVHYHFISGADFADMVRRGEMLEWAVVHGRAGLCAAAAWFVIAFEVTFPLALVLGPTGVAVYAAVGALFHVSNAVLMGLNTFVWAFVATYPAVLFCAVGLQR